MNLNPISSDIGEVDPAIILEQIELQIGRVKEEAFVRKEILEKVEKWLTACDEECWLEEYNRVKCLSHSITSTSWFLLLKSTCILALFVCFPG